ncbi:single-stranded DNA-binding protein [Ottowia sp.]|uniref:single-stranded DNA-binding protein n=1 Tax=Ottowia sp. TaxID=1898956 RepID=UPI002CA1A773|nr:single-stranded DNA-binding protein [Ottowia sp.]HRN76602.1 single-stranded DNA-binding protein [Ottowia sp.]HRQ03645.1 single-stranded DNA-binding protein [Ottowia sp.]
MIDALIAGKLVGAPQQRTGASGKPFVTARVRVPTRDSDAMFASVIAFSNTVQSALMALGDGDSVALSGELTPKTWTDRQGATHPALDVVAHAVLSAYHVTRRREAVKPRKTESAPAGQFDIEGEF